MLKEYSRVKLVTNRFAEEGASEGMVGYVIEAYADGKYEIEFSDPKTGCSVAQLVLSEEDVVMTPQQGNERT